MLIGMAMTTILVFIILALTKVSETQDANTAKNAERDQALSIVQDCLTEDGACKQRNQRDLADLVANLNRRNALSAARAASAAAYCANQDANMTYELILECTIRRSVQEGEAQ
jgi:hypothetical protein